MKQSLKPSLILFQLKDLSCLISRDESDVYIGKGKDWIKMKMFFMLRKEASVEQ